MLAIITIISINVSFQKQVRKNNFDVRRKFHMYVHVCVCTMCTFQWKAIWMTQVVAHKYMLIARARCIIMTANTVDFTQHWGRKLFSSKEVHTGILKHIWKQNSLSNSTMVVHIQNRKVTDAYNYTHF